MAAGTISGAHGAEADRTTFGTLDDGRAVEAVVLRNGNGVEAHVIALGATLQSLFAPDRKGARADIVLGYDTPQEYLDKGSYLGVSVGRYANRIANGRFTLDGETYQLETNDGPNHLHGGVEGFDRKIWTIEAAESGDEARVVLSYVSPDGEGGYPGELTARVTYSLNERNELKIEYEATTDAPTIVNLTNHAYFNLGGQGDVMGHRLKLKASAFTPVDETLIPTGELRKVKGTPFDFTKSTPIGERIRATTNDQIRYGRGYDHNFVIDGKAGELRTAAKVEDPVSGRVMELLTTAPGVQFYSGNFLDGTVAGKAGRAHRQGDAFCLEPQTFPDGPNKPDFPSARLDPGETYRNVMVFRLSAAGK